MTNADIVRRIGAAFARGDSDAFVAELAPDVEWRYADNFIFGGDDNPVIGRDNVRAVSLEPLKTEWDGFAGDVEDMIDGGDTVVALGHYRGTYRATGRSVCAQFAHIYTIADGKVVRWRQYVDTKQFADAVAPVAQDAMR